MLGARNRRSKLLLAAIPVLGLVALVFAWRYANSPERALAAFYRGPADGLAEDMLMDPLILAGDRVVPLVLREVERKDMPLRRYALGFLGNGAYTEALPTLERILANADELDYFRADSLVSAYKIDRQRGLALAAGYVGDPGFVGYVAHEVLAETKYARDHRTVVQAFFREHE